MATLGRGHPDTVKSSDKNASSTEPGSRKKLRVVRRSDPDYPAWAKRAKKAFVHDSHYTKSKAGPDGREKTATAVNQALIETKPRAGKSKKEEQRRRDKRISQRASAKPSVPSQKTRAQKRQHSWMVKINKVWNFAQGNTDVEPQESTKIFEMIMRYAYMMLTNDKRFADKLPWKALDMLAPYFAAEYGFKETQKASATQAALFDILQGLATRSKAVKSLLQDPDNVWDMWIDLIGKKRFDKVIDLMQQYMKVKSTSSVTKVEPLTLKLPKTITARTKQWIQMLLIMQGIEPNPGPKKNTSKKVAADASPEFDIDFPCQYFKKLGVTIQSPSICDLLFCLPKDQAVQFFMELPYVPESFRNMAQSSNMAFMWMFMVCTVGFNCHAYLYRKLITFLGTEDKSLYDLVNSKRFLDGNGALAELKSGLDERLSNFWLRYDMSYLSKRFCERSCSFPWEGPMSVDPSLSREDRENVDRLVCQVLGAGKLNRRHLDQVLTAFSNSRVAQVPKGQKGPTVAVSDTPDSAAVSPKLEERKLKVVSIPRVEANNASDAQPVPAVSAPVPESQDDSSASQVAQRSTAEPGKASPAQADSNAPASNPQSYLFSQSALKDLFKNYKTGNPETRSLIEQALAGQPTVTPACQPSSGSSVTPDGSCPLRPDPRVTPQYSKKLLEALVQNLSNLATLNPSFSAYEHASQGASSPSHLCVPPPSDPLPPLDEDGHDPLPDPWGAQYPISAGEAPQDFVFRGIYRGPESEFGSEHPQVCVRKRGDIWYHDADGQNSSVRITRRMIELASRCSPIGDRNLRFRNMLTLLGSDHILADDMTSWSRQYLEDFFANKMIIAFLLTGCLYSSGEIRVLPDTDGVLCTRYECDRVTDEMKARVESFAFVDNDQVINVRADLASGRAAPIYPEGFCVAMPARASTNNTYCMLGTRLLPEPLPVDREVYAAMKKLTDDLADYITQRTAHLAVPTYDEIFEEHLRSRKQTVRDEFREGKRIWEEDPQAAIAEICSVPYKSFIKNEHLAFDKKKPARAIMSLPEKYRGMQLRVMSRILWRIEKGTSECNVKGRTKLGIRDLVIAKFGDKGDVYEMDYTSFESCITPATKAVIENRLFSLLAETQEERDFVSRVLGRKTVCVVSKGWRIPKMPHIRMSGDYWTSLGNLVTNIVVCAYIFNRPVDWIIEHGLFEGDDGLMVRDKPLEYVEERAKSAGMRLKILQAPWNQLSFCGNHLEEINGELRLVRDPQKIIAQVCYLFGANPGTRKDDVMLERSKALSVLSEPWIAEASAFCAVVERATNGVQITDSWLVSRDLCKEWSPYGTEKCLPDCLKTRSDTLWALNVCAFEVAAGGDLSPRQLLKMLKDARSAAQTLRPTAIQTPFQFPQHFSCHQYQEGLRKNYFSHLLGFIPYRTNHEGKFPRLCLPTSSVIHNGQVVRAGWGAFGSFISRHKVLLATIFFLLGTYWTVSGRSPTSALRRLFQSGSRIASLMNAWRFVFDGLPSTQDVGRFIMGLFASVASWFPANLL